MLLAKVVSMLFRPEYYPVVCLCFLFRFSFLNSLLQLEEGKEYVFVILVVTALMTILVPTTLTWCYRRMFSIASHRFHHKQERIVPYVLHLTSFCVMLHLMQRMNVHGLVMDVIIVSTLIQVACTVTNFFWKVSAHAAGAGAVLGFLVAYGRLLGFSVPLFPIIISILLCGIVGTSRLVLRRHTLAQVNTGLLLGIACGMIGTMLSSFREIL